VKDSRREDLTLRGKHLNYLPLRRAGAKKSFKVLPETAKYTYFSTKIVPPFDTILHPKTGQDQFTNKIKADLSSYQQTYPHYPQLFNNSTFSTRNFSTNGNGIASLETLDSV